MAYIPPEKGQIPTKTPKADQFVDFKNLPCPIPYEEFNRESYMALKLATFEGARFDYNKILSNKFVLSHSATMGPVEIPSQGPEIYKIPTSNYEFGANYVDEKMMIIGRMSHEGRLGGRLKCDLLGDYLTLNVNGQLSAEPQMSNVVGCLNYKGSDYRAQIQLGTGSLFGFNYIQSVTPKLSLGGEIFYTDEHRKSGVGFAARYSNDIMVATGQFANTGAVALTYLQKITQRVSVATEFVYNYITRDVTATVGYDANFRQAHARAKIDTNGCVTALVEEQLAPGLGFLLSAELDHWKQDYKFGVGMTFG